MHLATMRRLSRCVVLIGLAAYLGHVSCLLRTSTVRSVLMVSMGATRMYSSAGQRPAVFAKTARRAIIGSTCRLGRRRLQAVSTAALRFTGVATGVGETRCFDRPMRLDEILATYSIEPTVRVTDIFENLPEELDISDDDSDAEAMEKLMQVITTCQPLLDGAVVGAAFGKLPDEDLEAIALHAKACPTLPRIINETLHASVVGMFGSGASLCLAGSHSESAAVRCCSDYDIWVRTKPVLVSKADRSELRRRLVHALAEVGFPVSRSEIGRKAIKLEFGRGPKVPSPFDVDVVCLDMASDCGFAENTFPRFTQCGTRAHAMQRASEHVRGSEASQIAIRAIKALCYHEVQSKGTSVPGFLLNNLARRIEMANLCNEAAQPRQPMNASKLFHRMVGALFGSRTGSNDVLSDLQQDADAAGMGNRFRNMLRRTSDAMCHTLFAVLSRDQSYLSRHAVLRGCQLPPEPAVITQGRPLGLID